VTRYDGWDDAAVDRHELEALRKEKAARLKHERERKEFVEVPAEESTMLSASQRLALTNDCTCDNEQGCLLHDPPAPAAKVTVVLTVAEAGAAYLALRRYSAMIQGAYNLGQISEEAYGALLSAREAVHKAWLSSAVDSPGTGA
jgi:hypothetical protein